MPAPTAVPCAEPLILSHKSAVTAPHRMLALRIRRLMVPLRAPGLIAMPEGTIKRLRFGVFEVDLRTGELTGVARG